MAIICDKRLHEVRQTYENMADGDVCAYQLSQINNVWKRASQEIPYYVHMKNKFKLPDKFPSLESYVHRMPILDKTVFQDKSIVYYFKSPIPNHSRVTGGTTSAPVQIPAWKSEYECNRFDYWVGRGYYGVKPEDRLFLFWGHSHLLGEGVSGVINKWARNLKDRVQNYVRYSCYDMQDDALLKAGEKILKSKPQYILGYSCALDRLSRISESRGYNFKKLHIKAIIGAAEAFPFNDSEEVIGRVFGGPVGMEYGSVETYLMAHTMPQGGYTVFWKNYLLEYDPEKGVNQEVIVTSLYDRCTPLFRYRIGDRIYVDKHIKLSNNISVLGFDSVVGRSNSPIRLPNGALLHSEAVTHMVRDQSNVLAYQFAYSKGRVQLRLITKSPLTNHEKEIIYSKANKIDVHFPDYLDVICVEKLDQTIAGKIPMIINET